MNNKELKIKEILEELYLIDQSLKEYQPELEKIIKKLLDAKPEAIINEQFKQELRRELLVRIQEIKEQQPVKLNKFMNIFSPNKLSYSLTGAVLGIIIVFGGVYYANQKGFLIGKPESGLISDFSVSLAPNEEFGSLKTQEQSSQELGIGSVAGTGGGGGMLGIAPSISSYRYIYNGDVLELTENNVEVLKREKNNADTGISNIIKNMNLGIVDLSSFSNARLDSASFTQEKDFGYLIHVNFQDGYVSLNNIWQGNGWKDVIPSCFEQNCTPPKLLKESDIPNEEKIIEIADNFISAYNISKDSYSKPETKIEQLIREIKRVEGMQGISYSPDTIRVIYPLIINDKNVYDEWGNKVGLGITINLRAMKVIGLDGLRTQNYQASLYKAETDFSKILEVAEKGGINQMVFGNNNNVVSVEISDPFLGYVRVIKYERGNSEEFLVPGLIFQISEENKTNNQYREHVVVPLAKELLE